MATIKFAVGLLLLLSLLVSISPLTAAVAAPDEAKWSRVNIPTEGRAGNRVLASGSDVAHLTLAIDGTLYAYVKGLTYTLFLSAVLLNGQNCRCFSARCASVRWI